MVDSTPEIHPLTGDPDHHLGVNMGTRFLASKEAPIDDDWKRAIIEACSEDAVKAEVINDIIPVPGTVGYGTVGRTLRTPFLRDLASWSLKGVRPAVFTDAPCFPSSPAQGRTSRHCRLPRSAGGRLAPHTRSRRR